MRGLGRRSRATPNRQLIARQGAVGGGGRKDVVHNGEFSLDALWTKGDGWTIGSGLATSDGTQAAASNLTQTTDELVAGAKYTVQFTITAISAGAIIALIGDTTGTSRTTVGTWIQDLTHTGAGLKAILQADAAFVGSVDNFKVLAY